MSLLVKLLSDKDVMKEVEAYSKVCLRKLPRGTLLELPDLVHEGLLFCVAAHKTYNPHQGSFAAYLRGRLMWGFNAILSREMWRVTRQGGTISMEPPSNRNGGPLSVALLKKSGFYAELSLTARLVVDCFVEPPAPIRKQLTATSTRKWATKIVRDYLSLPPADMQSAMTEIKDAAYGWAVA